MCVLFDKIQEVIECSSIYAIDFAAVVFSAVLHDCSMQYRIFLNERANIDSLARRYISRLAVPTLRWEVDPNEQLRQIHMPIENLDYCEFLNAVKTAAESYSFGRVNTTDERNETIENIISSRCRLEADSIDHYIAFISGLLEWLTGKEFNIEKFGTIREFGSVPEVIGFVRDLYSSVEHKNGRFV